MKLPKINFSTYQQPLRVLLAGNEDTWISMIAVIEDLKVKQLSYKHAHIKQRCISEMITHAIDVQYGFYTKHLVLSKKQPASLYKNLPINSKEAQQMIIDAYKKTIKLWKGLTQKDINKKINTEWGQTLTGELALFQSITHTHYHVSEICFLRSLGGFPTTALG